MPRHRFSAPVDTPIRWHTLSQLTPYLFEFKGRVGLAMACLIAAKLASIGLPFVLKHIVDTLDTENLTAVALSVPLALVAAYGALRFLNTILSEVRDTLFGRVTERAMRRLGLKVFTHLHSLDVDYHLSRQTGGLSRDIERGTSGIGFLLRFLVFNILPTCLEIIIVVGVLLKQYGMSFALIILGAVVSYVIFSIKATNWRTRFVHALNQADSTSNTRAIDSLLNFETVKYFNNADFEAQRYDTSLASWELARRQNRLSLFALNGGQALIIAIAATAMMINATLGVMSGTMTLGDFVLINAFTMQLFMPLNFLGFVYREIRGAMANIHNLFEVLERAPKVQDSPQAKKLSATQGRIRFEGVSFHYQPERPILRDVSFTVEPGQKVAVVGASGAGKSTLVKLLFRLYNPTQGEVFIDDQKITACTQNSVREVLGIVPQDTVLFNDSLLENIRYGDPQADDDKVRAVVKLAALDTFIASLPDGIQTQVGERGLKLSGGEKQRVAIARALLKNPQILVFDEATSSLDSQSEQAILQALKQAARAHTSLVIAHRLSTITDADCILVLDGGVLVEQGTHTALLQRNGHYARLWHVQQNT
ncbi:ABCB family ABC transporter ATP-binding protein/permease [Salinimonas sediminis]|uniref:ABC transporter ATP-binding protein/permease n=1 Tax=Salinimonas sediminis TaxID=2303538 RepID=A0A346NLA9_9ALTE|nr:ABC transporter ATP-binding protein/permease [Salinimonas sediminis]AXR06316.1 ABC transporter ATP-binding protein/permease [Salinimonas sediminis]